MLYITQIN